MRSACIKPVSFCFVVRVIRYPENMPNIDWSYYRTRIAAPGMVDAFEKGVRNSIQLSGFFGL